MLELDGDRLRFTHPLLASAVAARKVGERKRSLHRIRAKATVGTRGPGSAGRARGRTRRRGHGMEPQRVERDLRGRGTAAAGVRAASRDGSRSRCDAVKPFLIASSSRFRSRGPLSLTSHEYARVFEEVKSLGSAASTTRRPLMGVMRWVSTSGRPSREASSSNGSLVMGRMSRGVASSPIDSRVASPGRDRR